MRMKTGSPEPGKVESVGIVFWAAAGVLSRTHIIIILEVEIKIKKIVGIILEDIEGF